MREGVGDVRRDVWGMREGDKLNRGVSNGATAIPLPWTTILKH